MSDNIESIQQEIVNLEIEHRDLDEVIDRLDSEHLIDQLKMKRLKKRKLLLKDRIEKLKSGLIPDLNA